MNKEQQAIDAAVELMKRASVHEANAQSQMKEATRLNLMAFTRLIEAKDYTPKYEIGGEK